MAKLSPFGNFAFLDNNGDPIRGGRLFTWINGTLTKQTAFKDAAEVASHTNPIVLNSRGEPDSPIYLSAGVTYRIGLAPANDTSDPPQSLIRDVGDVQGVNDTGSIAISEWILSSLTPTFISSTSFSLPGDQTVAFHVGRRLKSLVTAGTVYNTISKSVFTSLTTITVDAANLDSGLSQVSFGIVSADNTSGPLPDTAILSWNSALAPHENLVITRPSTSTVTVTADKFVAENSSGRKTVLSTVSVTPNITASGVNGLDTGAEAAATWYHIWVIWNGVTISGLLSLSSTSPTMPSGYTHKAYAGAVRNDSASDFVPLFQRSVTAKRSAFNLLAAGTATVLTQISVTGVIPPNARSIFLRVRLIDTTPASGEIDFSLAPENSATFQHIFLGSRGVAADNKGGQLSLRFDFINPQELWYVVSGSTATATVDCVGWAF